jgi:hypothetical protein
VVHYPYDEHDPTFSSLSYRFDSRNYQKYGPVVKIERALIQPPHIQHDAQLAELRDQFKVMTGDRPMTTTELLFCKSE